jgi:hypothetical protein
MRRIVLSPEQLDAALAPPESVGPARLPCPQCGGSDHLTTDVDGAGYGYFTTCSGCYDCDCDESGFFPISPQGHGRTRAESCEAWNEAVETWEDGREARRARSG